jgi:hypothetical protein
VDEVTILMACFNGAAFLPEQLASIAAQREVRWRMIVGDDGSTDGTRALLEGFAADWPGRVVVVDGPGDGASAHFMALIGQAGPGALAFADQDDVWLPGKLAEALAALRESGSLPALFVSRGALWWGGETGRPLPNPKVTPGFRHALVQNIGPGHAMVVNAAAAEVLRRMAAAGAQPFWQDWWVYQVVTGVGGRVVLGREVQVLYRQHAGNLVGRAEGGAGAMRRMGRAASGQARREMAMQGAALQMARDEMTDEARQVLEGFAAAPSKGGPRGLAVWRLGLHRQGLFGRASVALAAWLGAL